MGFNEVGRRLAAMIATGVVCAAVGGVTQARAALSDSICGSMTTVRTQNFPTSADLSQVAASTEAQLARRGLSATYQDMLPVLDLATPSDERPTPAAVAQYCAAAGELMRISPEGSQLQAQSYLLNAFRMARASGLQDTASLAAYRLGLVSLSGPTVAGVRGARATRGGATAAVRNADTLDSATPCDVLLGPAVLTNTNLTLSMASLGCSAQQAASAGDNRTAALATLRLARLRLAVAEANSDIAPGVQGSGLASRHPGYSVRPRDR